MNLRKLFEVNIDNIKGAGAVPNNQDVDYFGMRVMMKPSTFLALASPLSGDHNKELEQYIKDGGAIGAPFLSISYPPEWEEGDFSSQPAKVVGHEGRNRMHSVLAAEGDAPIETHLFFGSGTRSRHLTDDIKKMLNQQLKAQGSDKIIQGPLFKT